MVTKKVLLKNTDEALRLMGQHDENIRLIERNLGVQIFVRQSGHSGDFSLVVRGPAGKVEKALGELERIKDRKKENTDKVFEINNVIHADGKNSDVVYVSFHGKNIRPYSEHQKKYTDAIQNFDLVIAIGPAGTGKTFLSVACALRALQKGEVSRIVLTRPVVEAGERLGFLPGDLYEKINPYLKPLYDAFYSMIGTEKFRHFRDDETIEISPLAYMRGRTIDDAFIILDEAQNTTSEQMKMFLTRIGRGSKVVITGDITQIDMEDKAKSGLVTAEKILSGLEDIKLVYFSEEDVVRHNLVKTILKAYKDWEKRTV